MKPKKILILLALLVLIGSGLYFFVFAEKEEKEEAKKEEPVTEKKEEIEPVEREFSSDVRRVVISLEREYMIKYRREEMAEPVIFTIEEGQLSDESLRIVGTTLPNAGKLVLNQEGQVALVIIDGDFCATKGFADIDFQVFALADGCKHPDVD